MIQEFSYGIIPIYKNSDWEYEILIVKKRPAWHWAFPWWHIEFTETPIQAAYRELHEETWIRNIEVNESAFFEMHYKYIKNNDRVEIEKYVWLYLWSVTNKQSHADLQELSEIKWVTLPEAIKEVTYPSSKGLVQKIQEYLEIKNISSK